MYSAALTEPADHVRERVQSGLMLSIVPDVLDGDARDLAISVRPKRTVVVRCVERATARDHTALATMISQGDFIWGAIVYSESAWPDPLGLIEIFHVDELDRLVSRLVELRGVFDEAG